MSPRNSVGQNKGANFTITSGTNKARNCTVDAGFGYLERDFRGEYGMRLRLSGLLAQVGPNAVSAGYFLRFFRRLLAREFGSGSPRAALNASRKDSALACLRFSVWAARLLSISTILSAIRVKQPFTTATPTADSAYHGALRARQ